MKLLILSILLCTQAFGSSITIEYPRVEKKPASKIQIVCEKTCTSNGKEVDSDFFKDKIGHIVQIEAKGDLPKSFQDGYIKKVTVVDGKHIVTFYMGNPKKYLGQEFTKFSDFNEIISEIEFIEKTGKEK